MIIIHTFTINIYIAISIIFNGLHCNCRMQLDHFCACMQCERTWHMQTDAYPMLINVQLSKNYLSYVGHKNSSFSDAFI